MRAPYLPDSAKGAGVAAELLPHVSRTFALTIPVLKPPLRDHVATAYVMCRIADTIEDAEGIPAPVRRDLFARFLEMVRDPRDSVLPERFLTVWCGRVDPDHERLMQRCGEVLTAYGALPRGIRRPIEVCLDEMVTGMAEFLERASSKEIGEGATPREVCGTIEELERYCHVVAGTVGILLTRLFTQELPKDWLTVSRPEEGRRFGLGLQLTNVLKDADRDRHRGISYLPATYASPEGLSPLGIATLLPLALRHLDQAQAYALSIPPERSDMRLFCLWASHLALATLARVPRHVGSGIKVGRPEVGDILEQARGLVGDDAGLEERHQTLRRRVVEAMRA
jgi:4,4'-diapophytoene synthase